MTQFPAASVPSAWCLTLAAALLMGIMVFVRQRLLDRELLRLLTQSRESFANLKRLQAQITESEKLASIGQLVGGAAHELNNPITAMLGYSDLLLMHAPNAGTEELAARIGQHARRTQVAGGQPAQFCQTRPGRHGSRRSQDLAADRRQTFGTAVASSQNRSPHRVSARIAAVRGDSNQLLQVCVQIINDALHAVDQHGSRTLTITAESKNGIAIVHIFDASPADTQEPDSRKRRADLASLELSPAWD